MTIERLSASFRDPAGFVFRHGGELYRCVDERHAEHFELAESSGLYAELRERSLLIEHEEIVRADVPPVADERCYKIIKPRLVPYVSYPYEWCTGQLRDAALLTLSVQAEALRHGMALRDASAYNVQFIGSRPIFIDTLSFERLREDAPWIAYGQFCRHFLAPLAAATLVDVRLLQLLRHYIDGLPLDLSSRLLPLRSLARWGLLAHVHAHAKSESHFDAWPKPERARGSLGAATARADVAESAMSAARGARAPAAEAGAAETTLPRARAHWLRGPRMTLSRHLALVASLEAAVRRCRLPKMRAEWTSYYAATNYTDSAMRAKRELVAALVAKHFRADEIVHDLGANTGLFARLIAKGRYVVAHDLDAGAVEQSFRESKAAGEDNVLPLVLDLANPSPALGWAHAERDSLLGRAGGGAVLALALLHHLVITNSLPMAHVADFFARMAARLVIEFVPKSDSQVARMLAGREDTFPSYSLEAFEREFSRGFELRERVAIPDTERILYAMERR